MTEPIENNEPKPVEKKPFVFDFDTFRFSVSSLQTFRQCGKKFEFSKVLKVKPEKESSHHRWFGRLVHNVIYESVADFQVEGESKQWVLRPIESRYSAARTRDLFNHLWNETTPEGEYGEYVKTIRAKEVGDKPLLFAKQKKKKSMDTNNQDILEKEWRETAMYMVNSGVSLLKEHLNSLVTLEYKLEFVFEGKTFIGYIDVLAKDEAGDYAFYDFKTSWDKHNAKKIIDEAQLPLYSYGVRDAFKLDYYPVGYIAHLRSGVNVTADINAGTIAVEKKRFIQNKHAIEEKIFDKSYGPLCPYCDFYTLCDPKPDYNRY